MKTKLFIAALLLTVSASTLTSCSTDDSDLQVQNIETSAKEVDGDPVNPKDRD